MSSKRLLLFLAPVFILAGLAADKPNGSGVIHLDHEQVAAVFAQGGPLLATNNFKVLALRRNEPGEVEVHEHDTDVLYVLEGDATLVTGGTTTEARNSAPGETRGKTIVGGEDRHLKKGDVMVIPNGVPHWFKEVKPPFLY
ncbi:MAG TPA: cupin domain-containing protein, partial [Patescibacteria group bacterium]|nr:cupin domain-containing protein [Patescibacteria group bacterium]